MEDRIVEDRQTKRHRLSDNLCFLSRHKPWPGSKYALVGQKIVFYQSAKMSTIFNHLPGKLRNIQSSRKKKKLLLCPSFTCALGWKDSAYFLA